MHRALDGKGPPPTTLLISRICAEFSCLPSRALWELEHDPDQLVLQVMDVRAYERAFKDVELAVKADKEEDLPRTALFDEVLDNRFESKAEEYERKKAAAAERARAKAQRGA